MPSETVKVVVRVRPFNQREKDNNSKPCIVVDQKTNSIELHKPQENDVKQFTYDYVFDSDSAQQQIYDQTAFSLIESVVEGYNGTIFAYGQTGCGKTFTMIGNPASEKDKGIIPRAFDQIISIIDSNSDQSKKYLLQCSYVEIYNEEIHDLLGDVKQKLDLKERQDGVYIQGVKKNLVKSTQEMDKFMQVGTANRSVRATAMNKESSRSHCLFTVYVECGLTDQKGNERFTAGKLNLVDLAGSERQQKTQATGEGLKEATKINLSLSALGNVISALVDGKTSHIPYRDSKLTRLLQDSLGGNTKTIMIAAVSPSDFNYDESLSSLRYASRAKMIKNQPKINEDPKDTLLKEQALEIQKLKELLLKAGQGPIDLSAFSLAAYAPPSGQAPGSANGSQQPVLSLQHGKTQELEQLKQVNNQLVQQKEKEVEGIKKEQQKALQEIEKSKNQLQEEKSRYEVELRQKEEQAKFEREERLRLEELIKQKEQMFMQGGRGGEEAKKKYNLQQKKVRQIQKEQEQLIQEREKKDDEIYEITKKYESVQDEVESLRKTIKYLQKKYQQQATENKDIQGEFEYEKEELLDTIRTQDKELKMLQAIQKMMFTEDELDRIKSASEWDDDKQEYIVPPFILKNKKVNFPKLPPTQANDFIEQEKQGRYLEFTNGNSRQSDNTDLQNRQVSPTNKNRAQASNSLSQLEKGMQVVEKQRQQQYYQQLQQQASYNPQVLSNTSNMIEKRAQPNMKLDPIAAAGKPPIQMNGQHVIQQNMSSPPVSRKMVQLQPMERHPQIPYDSPEQRRQKRQL